MVKLKVKSKEDPLPPEVIKGWNDYVMWLEKKGMAGSKELDKGDNGLKWLGQYMKETPSTPLRPEHIKQVQQEIQSLADNARAFAARKGDPNAKTLMTGTSKFDGIPGSKTTSFKFPVMEQEVYHNNNLVSKSNLGLLSGNLKPIGDTSRPLTAMKRQLPPGVKLEKWSDGNMYYEDPKNAGEFIMYRDK